jgi:peptide/nickel transport system substrate-binding protein
MPSKLKPEARSLKPWPSPWLAVLVLALALPGCRGPGTAQDEIVLLNEMPLPRLDPRYAATTWEQKVSQLVVPGLTGLKDRGLGSTAGLAESLVAEDDLTYRARLRPQARFSDGRLVTAADVKYTFDSFRDPLLGSPFRKTWEEYLAQVEILDAATVRFRLKSPRAPFPTDLETAGIVARHVAEPLDDAVRAAARAGRPPPPLDLAREVVGAGPYRLDGRTSDVITLERNPHALEPPATGRLVVRTIRDDNARVLALVGGSADVVLNGVTPLVVETLVNNPRLKVDHGPSATLTYLGFNLDDPVLKDGRVRQAIALALDRERLVAAKFQGRARPASSPLDASNPFFNAEVRPWPHDPASARRLLDEAGYPDPDGAGPRPRMRLTWKTSAQRFRVALVHAMARQLGEVGIAVDVRPFEFATFLSDVRKGNVQLFSLQMPDIVEPDMLRALFHSGRIPTAENAWAGANRFRFRNGAVDRRLDQAAAVRDPEQRKALYAEVQAVLAQDLPMLPLWHEDNVMVYRRGLSGVEVLKTGRLEGLLAAGKTGGQGP